MHTTTRGAAGQRFFEVRVLHGENPNDATYEYAIIPYADEDRLNSAYSEPTYEVLSNTKKLQSVHDFKTGISAYVFYEPDSCCGITAKNPCLISVHTEGECTVLSASDPTHKQDEVVIELDGEIKVIDTVGKLSVTVKDGKTYINLNVFSANGRRFEVKYNK